MIVEEEGEDDDGEEQFVDAEEKGLLSAAPSQDATKSMPSPRLSHKFWISAGINTASTAAIVSPSIPRTLSKNLQESPSNMYIHQIFVNKHIFSHPSLRHAQVSFAAFHFTITALLLYFLSRPRIGAFESKRIDVLAIMPLALGMILNVVLPNASLAYSSIQFYQVMRVLVTPCVCALNFLVLGNTTPRLAAGTLVPVCVGVGLMSWFDTKVSPSSSGKEQETSSLGVIFAFAGVLATAVYTVWIKKYHATLSCTSMQLLLNQAPVSVLLMLYIIPFADDVTVWHDVEAWTGMWILLVSLRGEEDKIEQCMADHN